MILNFTGEDLPLVTVLPEYRPDCLTEENMERGLLIPKEGYVIEDLPSSGDLTFKPINMYNLNNTQVVVCRPIPTPELMNIDKNKDKCVVTKYVYEILFDIEGFESLVYPALPIFGKEDLQFKGYACFAKAEIK